MAVMLMPETVTISRDTIRAFYTRLGQVRDCRVGDVDIVGMLLSLSDGPKPITPEPVPDPFLIHRTPDGPITFMPPDRDAALLDHFAGRAMQSLVIGRKPAASDRMAAEGIAWAAYQFATAMMEARTRISPPVNHPHRNAARR